MVDQWLIDEVKLLAERAGDAILEIYHQDNVDIQKKKDETPVTAADFQANAVIENGLREIKPAYPILSEESEHGDLAERLKWQRYWLVDPLDGTQEFINRNGQFTVNVALMEKADDGKCYPLFGVVYVPETGVAYWGGKTLGAFRQKSNAPVSAIKPRKFQPEIETIVLGSRSYKTLRAAAFTDLLHKQFPNIEVRAVGSALKTCLVAEGTADLYPRLGSTSEWDTGAAQGIVEGAGGLLLDADGRRFAYNFKESLLNSDFLVLGDAQLPWSHFWGRSILESLGE